MSEPLAHLIREFTRIFRNEHNVDGVIVKEDFLVIGEGRVVERSSPSATHRGSLIGEKPTNKRVAWTETHLYRVLDGRLRSIGSTETSMACSNRSAP
jgi:predicted ester cyclase